MSVDSKVKNCQTTAVKAVNYAMKYDFFIVYYKTQSYFKIFNYMAF